MKHKLLYSSLFPSREGLAQWRYFWDVFTSVPRFIKYAWQRASRGWADCDVWSMDDWFCDVVPGMLKQLADNKLGVPIDFEHHMDNWPKMLNQMAEDLEAKQRFDERWFGEGGVYRIETGNKTKQQLDLCITEEDAAYDKVKAGLASFYEYFFSLWD